MSGAPAGFPEDGRESMVGRTSGSHVQLHLSPGPRLGLASPWPPLTRGRDLRLQARMDHRQASSLSAWATRAPSWVCRGRFWHHHPSVHTHTTVQFVSLETGTLSLSPRKGSTNTCGACCGRSWEAPRPGGGGGSHGGGTPAPGHHVPGEAGGIHPSPHQLCGGLVASLLPFSLITIDVQYYFILVSGEQQSR